MDARSSDNCGGNAHRSGGDRYDPSCGVLPSLRSSFLYTDPGISYGVNSPSAEDSPVRQLPLLADVLTRLTGLNAKSLAENLLNHFGTIGRVFGASDEAILQVVPDRHSATKILAARDLAKTGMLGELRGKRVNAECGALLDYLICLFSGKCEEYLHAIFLDSNAHFIRAENLSGGSGKGVALHAKCLLRRSIELGAARLILAHNHPSGDPRPSRDDLQATSKLRELLWQLEISLDDHLIIAGFRAYSLRKGDLL